MALRKVRKLLLCQRGRGPGIPKWAEAPAFPKGQTPHRSQEGGRLDVPEGTEGVPK